MPPFKVRWRGYDQAQVEDYLKAARLDKYMRRLDGSPSGSDSDAMLDRIREKVTRVKELQREVAACLNQIGASADREGHTLLIDVQPSSEEQHTPADSLEAVRVETERLAELRRELGNSLVAIGSLAKDQAQVLLDIAGHDEGAEDAPEAGGEPSHDESDEADHRDTADNKSEPHEPGFGRSLRHYGVTAVAATIVGAALVAGALTTRPTASSSVDAEAQEAPGSAAPTIDTVSDIPAVTAIDRPSAAAQEVDVDQSPGIVLTLVAEDACWIRTRVDSGDPLERLLQPDDTIILHAKEEAFLRVGNAAAVSLLINNQATRTLGADGEVVEVRINHDNLTSYLAGSAQASGIAPGRVTTTARATSAAGDGRGVSHQ